ncbi:F-box protein At3g07870 [Linum perenne]
MIGGENSNNDSGGATYLTEDILIIILHWLPIASCIARFRCVCRSWRTLLSDPNFIRKIIVSQTSAVQKSLQVLITGSRDAEGDADWDAEEDHSPLLYSLYSYETLSPIPGYEESAAPLSMRAYFPIVVGCCGGIICLSQTEETADGRYINNIVLWNPATSESKFIPPGPSHPTLTSDVGAYPSEERIGFGYDPRTQDYKVVRVLEFRKICRHHDDADNDSWKTLNPSNEHHYSRSIAYPITISVNQQLDTFRNEKCYWFRYEGSKEVCAIVSFDMSTELFERVTFPQPAGLRYHGEGGVDPKSFMWCPRSCFMLKNEVLMVTFSCDCRECFKTRYGEKWVLLKHGVGESWTKLRAFMSSYDKLRVFMSSCDIQLKEGWEDDDIQPNFIWEDDAYICVDKAVCDIATGEAIREIETELKNVQDCIFAPTRVPMSQLVDSKSE